jgi:inosose dehydratase
MDVVRAPQSPVDRIAGAPISWGVCEVPDRSYQLGAQPGAGRDAQANLDRLTTLAGEHGVRAALHPHVGTMIETGPEVQRVLADCSVSLCLDTGHLLVGGTDPADVARQAPDRIAHTRLKDVDGRLARQVQSGRVAYAEAVRAGLYRPLGQGDVDVAAIVDDLGADGYAGWYVLEQDTVLTDEPVGAGPAADVHTSAEHLRALLARPALVP